MSSVFSINDLSHVVSSCGSSHFTIIKVSLLTGEVVTSCLPESCWGYVKERMEPLLNCIPIEERPFCARAMLSRVISVSPLDDGPQISLEHNIDEEHIWIEAMSINPADNRYLLVSIPHSAGSGYHTFGAMLEGIVTAEPDATPGQLVAGQDPRIQKDKVVAQEWIQPGKLVAVDKETGKLVVADATNPFRMPAIGVSVSNVNGQISIQALGFIQGQLSGLTTGKVHFVGRDGNAVSELSAQLAFMQPIGIALSTSVLSLSIGTMTTLYSQFLKGPLV